MAARSLPATIPLTSEQLIQELDELNPTPTIEGPIDPETIQELVYQAGRRSVVEELVRLLEKTKEQK